MALLNGSASMKLQAAVRAAELRQQIIANNIANAETPGFKRSEVLFEDMLQQMNDKSEVSGVRTDPRHIAINTFKEDLQPKIIVDNGPGMNSNGNTVDLDREMSLLAENQMKYNYYVQQFNHESKMMRIGIEGRS